MCHSQSSYCICTCIATRVRPTDVLLSCLAQWFKPVGRRWVLHHCLGYRPCLPYDVSKIRVAQCDIAQRARLRELSETICWFDILVVTTRGDDNASCPRVTWRDCQEKEFVSCPGMSSILIHQEPQRLLLAAFSLQLSTNEIRQTIVRKTTSSRCRGRCCRSCPSFPSYRRRQRPRACWSPCWPDHRCRTCCQPSPSTCP